MHRRHSIAIVSGLLISLGFAVPVFANTTNISSDPSYAAQPFSFYCQPYVNTFQTGFHYLPQSGACEYSVPSAVSGSSKVIAVYKGTPGNSSIVSIDQTSGSPTLVQEDSVNWGAPAAEQNYFAAIYDSAQAQSFADYFTTGSSTNTLPPAGSTFATLSWKWGPKPANEYNPVIIIPDILGAWQQDSGGVLDPIFHTYQNLIDTFVANGYVANHTLFTLPYNWESSVTTNAQALASLIASVKATCGCSYVDIVAHGTGGEIAESYVEGAGYQKDVNEIEFLGTPFLGVPAAYQAWEGGQIHFGNALQDGVAQVLLNAEAKDNGYASAFAYIQSKPVAGIQDILPTYDYLYNPNELFYPTGYPRNATLESLVSHFSGAIINKIRTHVVLADDNQAQTTSGFDIVPSTQSPLWPDGQPDAVYTDTGDGFTPRASIENFFGVADQEFISSHLALPTVAESDAFATLTGKNPTLVATANYSVGCALFITSSAPTDLKITDPQGRRLGKDFSTNTVLSEIPNAFYSGFNAPTEYGVIANPQNGVYTVQTQGTANGSFTINTADVCGSGVVATSTSGTTASGQLAGFGLTVATSTQTLTLASLDTLPPVVTITNPLNGSSHLSTATTTLTATAVDPEGSPIASTVFKINGTSVNQQVTFAYSTLPLGTSTLVVAATDIFGHTGYATSSFAVVAPAPPPPTGTGACAVALSSNEKGAITLAGSASIKGTNCGVQVNSNASGAVNISGSAKITSTKNCFVGSLTKAGSASVSPNPVACSAVSDPFAAHTKPAVASCLYNNLSIAGATNTTLNPGTYCDGITIAGSAKVKLNSGIYVFKGGDLNVAGSAQVTGDNVSLFMTGTGAGITLAGSGKIDISAPTSGTMAGFAVYLDPGTTYGTPMSASSIAGSGTLAIDGVVYLPHQQLNLAGSAKNSSSTFVAFIADTFNLAGSANLTATIPTGASTIPVPPGL